MSSSDVAIRVSNLGKCYQIYDAPRDRLKQFIAPRLQRITGAKPRQYFREFWALRDISFQVNRGEPVGIIGRNGAGKSTLLQIICGTLAPSSGEVEVNGRVAALLELGSGFNPEFTGRENVHMSGAVLGLSREDVAARFSEIAAFADLGDFIDQPVKTYSSGMYVRLAFAVIAHVDAAILVIDEALAVGDAFFSQKCMRFLRRFLQTGTILFVSHDTGAVVNLCKQALWLDKGSIRMLDAAKTVTESYLETIYEDQQGVSNIATSTVTGDGQSSSPGTPVRDQRFDFINHTQFRNDIQLFAFDADAPSFGKGVARFVRVVLVDKDERPLSWVVGGETVTLVAEAAVVQSIYRPIIGFILRDRLGQSLFSDNTYLSYVDEPLQVEPGERIEARFRFQMPILPVGDYSICVSIAEGTQQDHVQHQWIHDALIVKSHSSSVCTGLVGIPMLDIQLRKVAAA